MIFFDSYALFETYRYNAAYARFKAERIITSALNLGEFYYGTLKTEGKEAADNAIARLNLDLIEIDVHTVLDAMVFRSKNIKKKFSTVDCIGYALARKHGMKFLTGDRQFEGMDGVEFVR